MKYIFFLLLALSSLGASSQTYCLFDTLKTEEDSIYSKFRFWHNAHVDRVNHFRQLNPLRFNVKPTGILSGLDPGANCRKTLFVVPVVVHVMYNSYNPASNLHDSMVEKQIAILNKAFANEIDPGNPYGANTRIQFVLANKRPDGSSFNGINHFSDNSAVYERTNNAQKIHLSNRAYYDRERYLNIWVVDDIRQNNNSLNVKGYSNISYIPGIDGIVMRNGWFGDVNDCISCFHTDSRGFALVHEIGHYLGLFHSFEGGCSAGADSATCHIAGDFCCDTRPILSDMSCPVNPSTACPSLPYYGSQGDNEENFMSYAHEDCFSNFTPDQISVMHSELSNNRKLLTESININNLDVAGCMTASWFNVTNSFLCEPDSIGFTAIDHDGVKYRWRVYNDTVQVLDTTLNDVAAFKWRLTRYGNYHVKLSVVTLYDSVELERRGMLSLEDCGGQLASSKGNWYFGRYAGMNFKTKKPVLDIKPFDASPNAINTEEGSVSFSKSNGDLLFYGAGTGATFNNDDIFHLYKIELQQHIEINSSYPLTGDLSSSQGGIVVPFISDTNSVNLFTTHDTYFSNPKSGVYHHRMLINTDSLVDSNFYNRNLPVPIGSMLNDHGGGRAAELITALPNCDGSYYLFAVDWSGDTFYYPNHGYVLIYKVEDTVVTYIGKSDNPVSQYYGNMKVSPDGTKLAAPGIVFHIDKNTGALSTLKKLPSDINLVDYYGASFSPDSKLLYFSILEMDDVDQSTRSFIYQYDLESSDSLLDRRQVFTQPDYYYFASLQLGPDNKIYISQVGRDFVGVIDNPNAKLTFNNPNACQYIANGVALKNSNGDGGVCTSGLPNFIDAQKPDEIPLDFSMIDSACGNVRFYPNNVCDTSFKWLFGDGDSSTLRNPSHFYGTAGNYTVKLISQGDTQTRVLTIGITKPEIAGDTLVTCDLEEPVPYSISNINWNYRYEWSVSVYRIEGSTVYIQRPSTAGSILKLKATNPKNGCTSGDSIKVYAKIVTNNTIRVDSGDCALGEIFGIFGSLPTPSEIVDSVFFEWQYSTDKVNWITITGATGRHLSDTANEFLYYRRYAHNFICESYSNIVQIPRFKLIKDLEDVFVCDSTTSAARTFEVEITNPKNDSIAVKINHYNIDTELWSVVDTIEYPLPYTMNVKAGDSVRFDAVLPCKILSSRTAIVKSCEIYTVHPSECASYLDIITEADSVPMGKDTFLVVKMLDTTCFGKDIPNYLWKWQYCQTEPNGNYTDIPNSNNDTFFFTYDSCKKGYYRPMIYAKSQFLTSCFWHPACDPLSVGSGYIQPAIITHPTLSTPLIENSPFQVWCAVSPDSLVKSYNWESSDDGSTWVPIAALSNDTITLDGSHCYIGQHIRVKIFSRNNCYPVISNAAYVNFTKLTDLWAKDYPDDNGTEPHSVEEIFKSPDLWNRVLTPGTEHENPDFGLLYPNTLYTRVRNDGSTTSAPADLYLYWTMASTGERWPVSWHYDLWNNGFFSLITYSWLPMGSQINTSPIAIPAIPSGGSITLDYNWWPPNPADYHYTDRVPAVPVPLEKLPVCFLARIVECPLRSDFGMYMPETSDVFSNIRNNDNIVTRNTHIENVISTNFATPELPVHSGNTSGTMQTIQLSFDNSSSAFFDYGYITLKLDSLIFLRWVAGGMSGSGFTLLPDSTLQIATRFVPFSIGNIQLGDGEGGINLVQFHFYNYVARPTFEVYEFTIKQHDQSTSAMTGGFVYQLNVDPYTPDARRGKNDKQEPPQSKMSNREGTLVVEHISKEEALNEKSSITPSISAYPNPFSNKVNLTLNLPKAEHVQVEVYSSIGNKVSKSLSGNYEKGKYTHTFDGSSLAPGVYFFRVTIGNHAETLRVVLNR